MHLSRGLRMRAWKIAPGREAQARGGRGALQSRITQPAQSPLPFSKSLQKLINKVLHYMRQDVR